MSEDKIMMNKNRDNEHKWRKKNLVGYNFTLNVETEKDIIEHFNNVDNKRAYLIELIRKDMKKNGKKKI